MTIDTRQTPQDNRGGGRKNNNGRGQPRQY